MTQEEITKLIAGGKAAVQKFVDQYWREQEKFIAESPEDYENCEPDNFVFWMVDYNPSFSTEN